MPDSSAMPSLFDALTLADSARSLLACQYNPRVALGPTSDPKLIWYNPKPHLLPENKEVEESEMSSQLAKTIGLKIVSPSDACFGVGIVDRYGGRGLGRNGGSGRSSLVGDFYLKGVGQTPLLGMSTDATHLSGGAYLEECAKEVVISEVVAAEFPWGCVPVTALCLTGESVVWAQQEGEKHERQCILARPPFMRPAHFERAIGFDPADLNEITLDQKRVLFSIDHLQARCATEEGLLTELSEFWSRWSEQIAYGFAHRLSSGGLSTANVSIDGRWVDFGSWASLPSWGRYAFAPRVECFGEEFIALLQCMQSHYEHLAKQKAITADLGSLLATTQERCTYSFERRMSFEFLRVFGLSRKQAQGILQGSHAQDILKRLAEFLTNYQREILSIVYETEPPSLAWSPEAFWRDGRKNIRSLAGILGDELGLFAGGSSADQTFALVLERAKFIGRPRNSLYREQLKMRLYQCLEIEHSAEKLTADVFESLIDNIICESRRDSLFENEAAICVGHARSSRCGMVCYYNTKHKVYQGIVEWSRVPHYSMGSSLILGSDPHSGLMRLENDFGEFRFWLSGL